MAAIIVIKKAALSCRGLTGQMVLEFSSFDMYDDEDCCLLCRMHTKKAVDRGGGG